MSWTYEERGVRKVEDLAYDAHHLPRRVQIHDIGIDLFIEFAEERPRLRTKDGSGKMVAVQVKTGLSYVTKNRRRDTHIVFYADLDHGEYWLRHSLPVFLCLCKPDEKGNIETVYWERVRAQNMARSDKGWKILVPLSQTLSKHSFPAFRTASGTNKALEQYAHLHGARQLMRKLDGGCELSVTVTERHDPSGFGVDMSLLCDHEEVDDELWTHLLRPGKGWAERLSASFPWATVETDQEARSGAQHEAWDNETRIWDHESGDNAPPRHWIEQDDEDYIGQPPEEAGLIASDEFSSRYAFQLSLNEIGSSFLALDRLLSEPTDGEIVNDIMQVNG